MKKIKLTESQLETVISKVVNEQETSYRDENTGEKVQSTVRLDGIAENVEDNTEMLISILNSVKNIEKNLSRRWV